MPNKIRSFRAKKKLEVVAYAEAHNISVAAKVFDVDRKTNKRMELTKKQFMSLLSHIKEHWEDLWSLIEIKLLVIK